MKLPKCSFHVSRYAAIKGGVLAIVFIAAMVYVAIDMRQQKAAAVWRKAHAAQLAPLLQAKIGDVCVFKDESMCLIDRVEESFVRCRNRKGAVDYVYLREDDENLSHFDRTVPANGEPQAWNSAMKRFHGIPQ